MKGCNRLDYSPGKHIGLQNPLAGHDNFLNKRVWIIEILSGKGMWFDAEIHITSQSHKLNILIKPVNFISIPEDCEIDIALRLRRPPGMRTKEIKTPYGDPIIFQSLDVLCLTWSSIISLVEP